MPRATTLIDSSRCSNIGSLENPQPHSPPIVYVHHTDPAQSLPVGLTGRVIIAGTFYTGTNYPNEYRGSFFFADYLEGWVKVLQVDEEDNFSEVIDFTQLSGSSVAEMQSHPITGDIHFVHLSHHTVYRIKHTGTVSVENPITIPTEFVLLQNYPNPFNPRTAISYQLGVDTDVELTIYNQLGQEVRKLVDARKAAGVYQVEWNSRDKTGKQVVSGVYLYRLKAGSFVQTRKLILLR